nr:PREDICTED: uncharacterized protein LOC109041032 [Bemisia tabaci]
MSAELKAIRESLNLISLYNVRKAVICTDSLSSITLLSQKDTITDNLELEEVHHFLAQNKDLILTWTPGHENIAGNEMADKQTKDLHNATDFSKELIHYSNYQRLTKSSVLKQWQRDWTESTQTKGARLGSIQPVISMEAWFSRIILSKKATNIISRMRIGHGLFPEHLNRIRLKDNDKCTCGQIGTIDHILLHCTKIKQPTNIYNLMRTPDPQVIIDSKTILARTEIELYQELESHIISNQISC